LGQKIKGKTFIPKYGFPTPYGVIYFVFSELRWEIIALICLISLELLTITV